MSAPAVSFIFESFEGVFPEADLADLAQKLDDLRSTFRVARVGSDVPLHGSISMIDNGRELLGRQCWVEDVRHVTLGTGDDRFQGQRFTLTLSSESTDPEAVQVRLQERGRVVFTRSYDVAAYQIEWQLMRARVERVRDALGDPAGAQWLSDWRAGRPSGRPVLVDDRLRAWVCDEDLPVVLAAGRNST